MPEPNVTSITPAEVTDLQHMRFDRALERLHDADPHSRVALDSSSGLANGVDGSFEIDLPPAARELPGTDRAAAAAVLFIDEYGDVFGVPGWHVLTPDSASPLGRSMWFSFTATIGPEKLGVHVCADEQVVKHVRIERPVPGTEEVPPEDLASDEDA